MPATIRQLKRLCDALGLRFLHTRPAPVDGRRIPQRVIVQSSARLQIESKRGSKFQACRDCDTDDEREAVAAGVEALRDLIEGLTRDAYIAHDGG